MALVTTDASEAIEASSGKISGVRNACSAFVEAGKSSVFAWLPEAALSRGGSRAGGGTVA